MLTSKPKGWSNYDWIQYKHARIVYKMRDQPAPFQTYGITQEGWFEVRYGITLDDYIKRIKNELRTK